VYRIKKQLLPLLKSHFLTALATIVVLTGIATSAYAGDFAVLKTKMEAARESLVTMMLQADKRGPEQQKVVKDTADAVSEFLGTLKAPAGKEAQFKELVETWSAFKETREKELVPLILKGNDAEAKKMGGGIQKERMTRCKELTDELDM
jgi:hypothetical protein